MDASGRHGASIFSNKKKAGGNAAAFAPCFCFLAEQIWNVDAADFSALGIKIKISAGQMLHFDLYQFTDSGAGGYQKTDNKVPEVMMLCLQLRLESFTVLVCDDRVLKGISGAFTE